MGQCMSCKVGKEAYPYTTSHEVRTYPHYLSMEHGRLYSFSQNESKGVIKRNAPYSRGQATLFGFKRRPVTAPSSASSPLDNDPAASTTSTATPFLSNRNNLLVPEDELNNISPISSSKSTPRLARPKKDVDGTNNVRTNRFGFRSNAPLAITNKVADSNCNVIPSPHILSHTNTERPNVISTEKPRAKGGGKIPIPKSRDSGIPLPAGVADVRPKSKPVPPKPEPNDDSIPATRFTLQTTHLPKLQYPVRLSSADIDTRNTSTSKIAKTAANNSTRRGVHVGTEESSSKEGSVNEDSGIGSHQSTLVNNGETDTLHGVEILESSPTFGYRRNRNLHKPRNLEMVVSGKCFDVQDLKDDESDPNVITEISVISLPKVTPRIVKPVQRTGIAHGIVRERSRLYGPQIAQNRQSNDNSASLSTHSDSLSSSGNSNCSEIVKEEGEEKAFRDSSGNEKSNIDKQIITPGSMEGEDWGHGEAMAEEFSSSSDDVFNQCNFSNSSSSLKQSVPTFMTNSTEKTNSVILKIEDSRFAAFAATTSTNMIEDEKSPVDSLISSASTPSSSADDISEEEQHKSILPDDGVKGDGSGCDMNSAHKSSNTLSPESPESPGTPTNASNSLSLSEGRDFLIDDEIADQPGLTFDDGTGTVGGEMISSSVGCSSLVLSVTENLTLVDTPVTNAVQRTSAPTEGTPSPAKGHHISRTGSVDTLSPCESIASDDLMLDFERSERSELDCTVESHPDGSVLGRQQTLDSTKSIDQGTDDSSDDPVKEWSVTASSLVKEAGLVTGRSRLLRPRAGSTPDSPRSSVESRTRSVASPLRPQRQSSTSDNDDGGLYLDRHTYHSICQDIVNHKTMLLKLMRHLQKAETLNPFDSSLKNGLFYNLASTDTPSGDTEEGGRNVSLQEEVADLQRQVVFLQQQLEEREHTIQLLQIQMTKYSNAEVAASKSDSKETCNAATQTERIRPVSAGPSLLQQPLPSDGSGRPLVSLTDVRNWQRQPTVGSPAPVKSATRLPLMRQWKRSNFPQTDLGGNGEQSNIPVSKQNTLNLPSMLPQKLIVASTDETVASLPSPSATDRHPIHVTTK